MPHLIALKVNAETQSAVACVSQTQSILNIKPRRLTRSRVRRYWRQGPSSLRSSLSFPNSSMRLLVAAGYRLWEGWAFSEEGSGKAETDVQSGHLLGWNTRSVWKVTELRKRARRRSCRRFMSLPLLVVGAMMLRFLPNILKKIRSFALTSNSNDPM